MVPASRTEAFGLVEAFAAAAGRAQVIEALRGNVDIDRLPVAERRSLLRAASREGVLDLLMSRQSEGWIRPADSVAWSVLAADMTRRVVTALEEAAIACAVLKGTAVANVAWREPAQRPQSDIDVLVRREDLPRARELLVRRGLAVATISEGLHSHHLKLSTARPTDIHIELHHELAELMLDLPVPVDAAELLRRAIRIHTPDGELPALSHEDAVIHLALQAAVHTFDRLSWLVDLAGYAERLAVDWGIAAERARAWRVGIPVEIAWNMAVQLLDARIPPEALGRLGTSWPRWTSCHALLACAHRARGPLQVALKRAFRLALLPSEASLVEAIRRKLLVRAEAKAG